MILRNKNNGDISTVSNRYTAEEAVEILGLRLDDVEVFSKAEWALQEEAVEIVEKVKKDNEKKEKSDKAMKKVRELLPEIANEQAMGLLYVLAPAIDFHKLSPAVRKAVRVYAKESGLPNPIQ